MHMNTGLTTAQEIIEARIENDFTTSFEEAIMAALAERPLHRIVSASIMSAGENNAYLRALIIIEHLNQ